MVDEIFNKKLKNGDTTAYNILFKELYPRLLGYCKLFINDKYKSEDLVQECFENLWNNKNNIDINKSVGSLLFVSLRNKCFNFLKQEKKMYNIKGVEEININELEHLYQIDFLEKEEITLEEQLYKELNEAINKLPEKRKIVFTKCKIQGIKQKDVAKELNISIKAVEKHISSAKKQLKELLKVTLLFFF